MKTSSNEIVNRFTSFITNNNINLYQVLSEFDLDGNGFITLDDLKYAFVKLKFNINGYEMEHLLRSLNRENADLIPVKEFVRNFILK